MRFIILTLSLLASGPALSQHSHSGGQHLMGATGPEEPGQSAFAALAEIVTILRNDPDTDWSSVNIAALRRHLIDMDLLTTDAEVTAIPRSGGARFEIRGGDRTLDAIRAMVPAHAPFLEAETGWSVMTELSTDGATLTVEGEAAQIQALGFFGMMTIGAHHQEHHLMLAKGSAPHQ